MTRKPPRLYVQVQRLEGNQRKNVRFARLSEPMLTRLDALLNQLIAEDLDAQAQSMRRLAS